MAQTDAAGNIITRAGVLAGSSPQSVVVPAGTTGSATADVAVLDAGAVYAGLIANVIGSASVSAGAVTIYASLDGVAANAYALTGAITVPTSTTPAEAQTHPTAGRVSTGATVSAYRFLHVRCTTTLTGAAATVQVGSY